VKSRVGVSLEASGGALNMMLHFKEEGSQERKTSISLSVFFMG